MYPHEYSVKQSKKILKKKNIKGCSRYDKTQLNRKILNVSNEEYHKRKNEKYETIEDVVLLLTKDENIKNHIMSYLTDTNYYAYIHDVVHFHVLNELQLFRFASFSLHFMTRNAPDDDNERTLMFDIHNYLIKYPVSNTIKVSNFILDRLHEFKLYCLNIQHLDGEFFVVQHSIFRMIKHYNKNARHDYNYNESFYFL